MNSNLTHKSRMLMMTAVMSLPLALTACGSDSKPAPAPTAAPTVSAAPTPSASPGGSPAPSTAPTPSAKPEEGDSAAADKAAQVKGLMELARKGQIAGVEYAAHTGLFDEVEKKWGKPDKQEGAGKGQYATYEKRGVTFGFNKGMLIFDVRSYDKALRQLALADIKQTLGEPAEVTVNGGDTIYTYAAGSQYQLKFVIPKSTGRVDHISVYSPQDAKNLMAG
ncbi:YjgB family protein [Paenibacillus sp. 1P03SA]|uniref:YjgB family protein n=1 Tax=Paenibacillus sp. 1P03SA TaxID=3132294 RepID=UPI0039A1FEBD